MTLAQGAMAPQRMKDSSGRWAALREQCARLYRYRALVQVLVARELKARYRGTALGFFWSFVNPLLLMLIYTLVFSVYMRIDMEHYSAFLLSGILPWACFSAGLTEGMHAIISNGGLIKKIYLPSEVFPLVYVIANVVHFLLSLPILLVFMLLSHIQLSATILFFPIVLGIQFLFTYALTLLLSSLAVQFRDLVHVVPNLLMIWFFLTPLFYPIATVPEKYRALVDLNPMAHLITAYQGLFFYQRLPAMTGLGVMALLSCALLALGLSFFESRKDFFAEEL